MKPPVKPAIAAPFVTRKREEVGPLLVAGSTLDGEEAMLLNMFQQVLAHYANAVLLLAPRHPQRFDEVASLLESSGLRYQRRSQWKEDRPNRGEEFSCSTALAN